MKTGDLLNKVIVNYFLHYIGNSIKAIIIGGSLNHNFPSWSLSSDIDITVLIDSEFTYDRCFELQHCLSNLLEAKLGINYVNIEDLLNVRLESRLIHGKSLQMIYEASIGRSNIIYIEENFHLPNVTEDIAKYWAMIDSNFLYSEVCKLAYRNSHTDLIIERMRRLSFVVIRCSHFSRLGILYERKDQLPLEVYNTINYASPIQIIKFLQNNLFSSKNEKNMHMDIIHKSAGTFTTRSHINDTGNEVFELLLIKKIWSENDIAYVLPKGTIEEGESISETAIRETKEETGIDSVIIQSLPETKYEIEKNGVKGMKIVYWFWATAKYNTDEVIQVGMTDHEKKTQVATEWVEIHKSIDMLRDDDNKKQVQIILNKILKK